MGSVQNEQYVSVELYIPKIAVVPRKQLTRRKTEKRESQSVRSLSATLDGGSKKVKEKSSWLGLPTRSGGSNEPWRPATCKLVEENGGCVFSVYLDDSKLYQSVYVHKLNHTDIRHVHHSLVDRKNCLGIHCTPNHSSFISTAITELYLHFPQSSLMNTWMALLRSYSIPEVYGRWTAPSDGGLYRMWRQVKLTCIQGRSLGASRPLSGDTTSFEPDSKAEADAIDLDVYCEIFVNTILCGRTTVKKCIGNPDWSESFTFEDLSPFQNLEIVVYQERKLVKPQVLGSILIYLLSFRRGEYVEGWFPVVNSGSHVGVQLGELRLKMRVDEEIILPSYAYTGMHRVLQSRNCLDWINDFETKLKLKDTIEYLMAIAQAHDVLVDNIMDLAGREVDGTHSTHNTLFRGNTVFTKAMEVFMFRYGSSFLEASLGPVIRRLCTEKVMIEIDPGRSLSRHSKGIERNVDILVYWCNEFWISIYEARHQCPSELRTVFAHIRQLVETRYVGTEAQKQDLKDLPWQSVSSFLFLRFMVPAILHPHMFGIWPGLNDEQVRRSLTLIAKVMQSLANLNTSVQKEEFMHAVKDFLSKSSSTMLDYIVVVSTPTIQQEGPANRDDRISDRERRLQNFVYQRTESLRRLHREAILMPPNLFDVPRHYASIASLVVRYSRRCNYHKRVIDPVDAPFDNFYTKSMEVEEQALSRVSELAKKPKRDAQPVTETRISRSLASPTSASVPIPSPPVSPTSAPHRERKASLQNRRRRSRRSARPATAPDSEGRSQSPPDASAPSSPTASHSITRMFSRSSLSSKQSQMPSSTEDVAHDDGEPRSLPATRPPLTHHPRSTSTDSALFRKSGFVIAPSTSSVSHTVIEANPPDSYDEKKRKGLLRGILRM